MLEGHPHLPQMPEDPQRAVIERRIAPDQQPHPALRPGMRREQPAIGSPRSPGATSSTPRRYGPRRIAHRQVELHHPRRRVLQVPPADLPPELRQIVLRRPLARHQHQIAGVERPDRLHRHVLRVAGPDPDQHQMHRSLHRDGVKEAPAHRPPPRPRRSERLPLPVEELGQRRVLAPARPAANSGTRARAPPPPPARSAHPPAAAPAGTRGSSSASRSSSHARAAPPSGASPPRHPRARGRAP